jgi:hypothetical protein
MAGSRGMKKEEIQRKMVVLGGPRPAMAHEARSGGKELPFFGFTHVMIFSVAIISFSLLTYLDDQILRMVILHI